MAFCGHVTAAEYAQCTLSLQQQADALDIWMHQERAPVMGEIGYRGPYLRQPRGQVKLWSCPAHFFHSCRADLLNERQSRRCQCQHP